MQSCCHQALGSGSDSSRRSDQVVMVPTLAFGIAVRLTGPCHCVLHKLLFSADVSLTHSVLSGLYTWNPLARHGNYEPYGSSSTTSVGFGFTCGIIAALLARSSPLICTGWSLFYLTPPDQLFCRNCLQIQLHHSTGPFLRSFRAWTLVYLSSSSALFVWVKSGISSLLAHQQSCQ